MRSNNEFPLLGGILLGIGLGGFVDMLCFRQTLPWHQTLSSSGSPANTLRNLQIDTLADGLFHLIGDAFVIAGLAVL
jgi:uncharacterized membrane protein